MSPKLDIQLDRQGYAPGDRVSGTVSVVEGGRSRSLDVHVEYREKTSDYIDAQLKSSPALVHQGDLETGSSHAFTVELPSEAPPAFISQHGVMGWVVVARSDEFGPDTVEAKQIDVQPRTRDA